MAETELGEMRDMATADRPEEARILALFDHFGAKADTAGNRGCPFVHASLQADEPAGAIHALVRSYKHALRGHVLGLLDRDRADPGDLADQIVILLDGMVTQPYLKAAAHPADAAKRAATILLCARRAGDGG